VDRVPSVHRLDAEGRRLVRERLREVLAADRRVAFAFVFGSFSEDRPFHDIDVGVCLESPGLSVPGTAAIPAFSDLEGRLTDAAGYPVDLVVIDGRPVTFLYHVFRGELVTARDEAQVTRALERTMREYFDIAPLLRQATREAFGT